jgi:DNA topoisomerase-2
VRDVIRMVRARINGQVETAKIGWEGFKGVIEDSSKGGYIMHGNYSVDDNTVVITELPVKKWTRDYKSFLEEKL